MAIVVPKMCFNFLKALRPADVHCVPPEEALRICFAEAIRGRQILCLWTGKLLPCYGVSNVSRSVYINLWALLNHMYIELLKKRNSAYNSNKWLKDSLNLFTNKNLFNSFSGYIFVNFGLQTVCECLQYQSTCNQVAPIDKGQGKLTINLHNIAVMRLEQQLMNIDLKDTELRALYINVFKLFCNIGKHKRTLYDKFRCIPWRFVNQFIENSLKIPESQELRTLALHYLLSEIVWNIENICKENDCEPDYQRTVRLSRINAAYLQHVKLIAYDFQQCNFPAIEEFFDLFRCVHSRNLFVITYIYRTHLTLIYKPLTNEIFALVFKHPKFNELVLAHMDILPDDVAYDYIAVILETPDVNFIMQQSNLLKRLFRKALDNCADDLKKKKKLTKDISTINNLDSDFTFLELLT